MDRWVDGLSLQYIAPNLVRKIPESIKSKRSVAQGFANRQWVKDITGALDVQTITEFLAVWDLLLSASTTQNQEDVVVWRWN